MAGWRYIWEDCPFLKAKEKEEMGGREGWEVNWEERKEEGETDWAGKNNRLINKKELTRSNLDDLLF